MFSGQRAKETFFSLVYLGVVRMEGCATVTVLPNLVPLSDYICSVITVMLRFLSFLGFFFPFSKLHKLSSLTAGWKTCQTVPAAMLLHVEQN